MRQRSDLVEIVSAHVALRKAGRRLKGLCPFHQERSPSFTVDPELQLWHCYGCKAGGDVFTFVQLVEHLDFAEALEQLARRAGLPPRPSPSAPADRGEKELLGRVNAAAARFFGRSLASAAGAAARRYLAGRGLTTETIESFRLGLAPPGWDGLLTALGKEGFSPETLERAGLAVRSERGDSCYDRFRDRIIFPILDPQERIAGFGGRLLEGEEAKYINSPETPLFHKGRLLYGLPQARRAMGDKGRAIVVEGYFDLITAHQAGLTETVATLGTALTRDHLEQLRRRAQRVYLAFDADSAGLAAALRSRQLFDELGLEARAVSLPPGQDPDLLLREQGLAALEERLAGARPLLEYHLTQLVTKYQGKREEGRLQLIRDAVPLLVNTKSEIERNHYGQWLADQWHNVDPKEAERLFGVIQHEVARRVPKRTAVKTAQLKDTDAADEETRRGLLSGSAAGERRERIILGALLQDPSLLPAVEELGPEDFAGEECAEVFRAIQQAYRAGPFSPGEVRTSLETEEACSLLAALLLAPTPLERKQAGLRKEIELLKERKLRQDYALLQRRVAAGEVTDPRDPVFQELSRLRRQLTAPAGRRALGEES